MRNTSPLRQSPPRSNNIGDGYEPMTEKQMPQRSFNLHSESSNRRIPAMEVKKQMSQPAPSRMQAYTPPAGGNDYMQSLLDQVKQLQAERDHFANESHIEKAKNLELENEFHVLRGLITEA